MSNELDARLGKHGGTEAKVCAVSGQSVRGRHHNTYALRDGYYYRVLAKYVHKIPTGLPAQMLALVPTAPEAAPEVVLEDLAPDEANQPNEDTAAAPRRQRKAE